MHPVSSASRVTTALLSMVIAAAGTADLLAVHHMLITWACGNGSCGNAYASEDVYDWGLAIIAAGVLSILLMIIAEIIRSELKDRRFIASMVVPGAVVVAVATPYIHYGFERSFSWLASGDPEYDRLFPPVTLPVLSGWISAAGLAISVAIFFVAGALGVRNAYKSFRTWYAAQDD